MANPRPKLSNLRPWTSETAPKGRKNAGLSVTEWRNQFAEYPRADIESVLIDPKAPASKLIAAREMLDAIGGDARAIERVCDYTEGKATQRVDVKHDGTLRTIADGETAADQALARLRERLGVKAG